MDVMDNTKVTAAPIPAADFRLVVTPKNEQMPKKRDSKKLFTKAEPMKINNRSTTAYAPCLRDLSSRRQFFFLGFLSGSTVSTQRDQRCDETHRDKRARWR